MTVPSLMHLCLRQLDHHLPAWMPQSIQEENAALIVQRFWRQYKKTHQVYTDSRFLFIATDIVDYNGDGLYLIVGPKTLYIWYAHSKLEPLHGCRVSKRIVERLIDAIFTKLRL